MTVRKALVTVIGGGLAGCEAAWQSCGGIIGCVCAR